MNQRKPKPTKEQEEAEVKAYLQNLMEQGYPPEKIEEIKTRIRKSLGLEDRKEGKE